MDATAIRAMMSELAPVIREYVDAELSALASDHSALAARLGNDCDEALRETAALVARAEQAEARARELEARLADLEKREPGVTEARALAMVGEKGVEIISLSERVAELETRALPEKGERGDDGLPGENGANGAPGEPGRDGKDGVGLADALIDKDGQLVLTMTNGTTKSLGRVVGKDGEPGATFTLDDFDVIPVDERTIRLCFTKGDTMHSFELAFPVLIGRGIWNAETEYERGDVTTWGGTAWEAVEPEKGVKPDQSSGGWRILAKRGRDGK